MQDRRTLLKSGLGLGASAGLLGALPGLAASAQASTGDYKAIVCVMLRGGPDGHDMLIPTGPGAYARYEAERRALLDIHNSHGDDSRARGNLIPVADGGAQSGFGMPRQLAPLAALHRAGHLSVVANVGQLEERTNRAAIQDGRAVMPPRLGSHNDQRSLWHTGLLERQSDGVGWGGAMAQAAGATDGPFTGISFTDEAAFAASRARVPYRMSRHRIATAAGAFRGAMGSDLAQLFEEHYRAGAAAHDNLFATDFQNAQRAAYDASVALYQAGADSTAGDAVRLTGNALSEQLAMAAKVISLRGALGVRRQVFVVTHDGFDTHAGQAIKLPELQALLADALSAFYQETVRQGVASDVLTFTTAEFGRSLTPNANGTDHGWGNHHLVMGGSVRGGLIHGDVPEVGVGHDLDWDRGRTIPTTATEQYVAGVGRWFGVPQADLGAILPRLARFGEPLAL